MSISNEFIEEILNKLFPLGDITKRFMFGGAGLFIEERMFAKITSNNVLSFKGDNQTEEKYALWGMTKVGKMPYYDASPEQLEDAVKLLEVGECALAAAFRQNITKKNK